MNNKLKELQINIEGNYPDGGRSLLETLIVAGAIALAIFLVDTIFLTAQRIKDKKIIIKH